MKKVALGSGVGVASVAALISVASARYQPTIRAETFAGPVSVGGLTPDAAAKKLRLWWEFERIQKFDVAAKGLTGKLPQLTPVDFGVVLDDLATVAQLPVDSLTESVEDTVTRHTYDPVHADLMFKSTGKTYAQLADEVQKLAGQPQPASVDYVAGSVVRTPEVPSIELDRDKTAQSAMTAIINNTAVELPLKVAEKHVPDDALATITDEVSEFSTRFPAYNRPRCSNIKLAAHRLSGHIILPGERMSFNDVVGRRTIRRGFQLAGIYKNGKHDTGIGGGICQVSTTLYNASLLGDLKIHRRSNHSMPVAYVPLGRDATVDYGNLDLVIENSYPTPIAIVSEYEPGRLTFRVLGKKDPNLEVKIMTRTGRTDGRAFETQYVKDPTLPQGVQKVVEPGSIFRSVLTYRKIFRGGRLVETQPLGPSFYGGMTRIISVGSAPKPAPVSVPPRVPDLPTQHLGG